VEDLLVTAGDDDSIHLYNTHTGILQKTLFSKKYGACRICFSHHPNAVIYASRKVAGQTRTVVLSLVRCVSVALCAHQPLFFRPAPGCVRIHPSICICICVVLHMYVNG
jgi:hypothetical protein